MNEIETKVAYLSLLDGDIVSIRYKNNAEVSLQNAKELYDAILRLNSNICPVLIFYNKSMSFDFEAIKFLAKSKQANAIAIVNKNSKSMDVLNATLKLFTVMKAGYKIKFFTTADKAKNWLLKYIQK